MNIMKLFESICNKIEERKKNKAFDYYMRNSLSLIQLREWRGKTYICFDDIPLLDVNELKKDTIDELRDIRFNYINFNVSK